jgi:hypothetical protein
MWRVYCHMTVGYFPQRKYPTSLLDYFITPVQDGDMSNTEQQNEPVKPAQNNKGTGQYFLVLLQAGFDDDPCGSMDRWVFHRIQEKLDSTVTTPRDETEIDVWLESPGGDAHIAYKLFLELRSRAKLFRVIVPDYAKSAATLFAIGADELWMAAAADLGPLDAQLEHPDREGVTVSALDVANALAFLMEAAKKYLVVGGGEVLKSTGLPRADVLEKFSAFSAEFFRPIMTKLDPHLIHRASNQLEVARRYAKSMLRLRNQKTLADDMDSDDLAGCLVSHYPSHGFVISRNAMASFGLPVKSAEDYNYWARLKQLMSRYRAGQFVRGTENGYQNHFIEVWSFSDLRSIFPIPPRNLRKARHRSHCRMKTKAFQPRSKALEGDKCGGQRPCCAERDRTSPVRYIGFLSRKDVVRIGRSLWLPKTEVASGLK